MRVAGAVQKICVYLFSIGVSLFLSSANYACGDHTYRDPKPYVSGCERLEVVVHNTTNYTFKADTSFKAISSSGSAPLGVGSFSDIPPNAVTTLAFDGSKVNSNDTDRIDTSMRYYAMLNGNRVGPQMMLYAQKLSCNVGNAEVQFDDDHCYDHYTTGDCSISCSHSCAYDAGKCNGGCSYCTSKYCDGWNTDGSCSDWQCNYTHNQDYVCNSEYNYDQVNCSHDGVNTIPSDPSAPSSASSSVTVDAGLFTEGTTFTEDGNSSGENPSAASSTYSSFTCDYSSECGSDSNGNCNGGTSEHNKTAKLEFYIKPSPIEKLTITFPFNNQSPFAKTMFSSIYNNLQAKYLSSLSIYYSAQPIVVDEKSSTMAFSMLCNSASCPPPPS